MHNIPHSEEAKAKMSKARKRFLLTPQGIKARAEASKFRKQFYLNPENQGLIAQMRRNQSEAQKGRVFSAETKAKISAAHMGKVLSEETRAKLAERSKGNSYHLGYSHTEEAREKIRKARAKQVFTPEIYRKRAANNSYLHSPRPPEVQAKMSASQKGKKRTPEQIERNRQVHLGQKVSKETRQKMRDYWASLSVEKRNELIHKMWSAAMRKPNRKEKYLSSLLQEIFPNEWKYVGNGKLVINGKIPDFVNVNGKKQIIELYGEYWHKGADTHTREKLFAEFGYETLIIWEHELNNPIKVLAKIKRTFYTEDKVCTGG